MTRRLAKMGDKTTQGYIISASSSVFDEMKAGDKAWCNACKGGFEIAGTYTGWIDEHMLVGNGDRVICRCKNNQVFATSGYSGNRGLAARFASTPLAEGSPIQHAQAAKKSPVEALAETPPLEPLPLPARIYETKRQMDDYKADDMRYGDLTEEELKRDFGLKDISSHIEPFKGIKYIPYNLKYLPNPLVSKHEFINLETSANLLFDEFRYLSDFFSFWGDYKFLIRNMITHMQFGNGEPFKDSMLDKAMEQQIINDTSEGSTLMKIKKILNEYIDYEQGIYPLSEQGRFKYHINRDTTLPKFTRLFDSINGLVISVHDTWATHITLESLTIEGENFHASVQYHIQDHFGLDNDDIKIYTIDKPDYSASGLFYSDGKIMDINHLLQR